MKLSKLLSALDEDKIYGPSNLTILAITDDSRKVKKGSLFVAIHGLQVDGHEFIDEVISKGAVVIVGERTPRKEWLKKITYIKVKNSRKVLALVASAWYGNPSRKLKMIGVTGTDGKTTTAAMMYHLFRSAGKKVGLVTTVSVKIADKEYSSGLHVTSPEPLIIQKILFEMVKAGCEFAILEVTSHGIDQQRIAGIDFELAVLTNITHEHLDYHKTFEEYKNMKLKFLHSAKKSIKTPKIDPLTKGITETYNQKNMSLAIKTARVFGINDSKIKQAIKTFPGVVGRLEEIKNNKGFKVYVDFAHTPNSLENVLSELKKNCKGRLICVFGCAGERDAAKRSLMGEISARLADISIFTAEDPRSEDVNKIIAQIVKSAKKAGAKELEPKCINDSNHCNKSNVYIGVPERGEAIAFAIQKLAKKGDTVIICGKGHEKSMAYNGIEYPWSEHEAVRLALKGGVKRVKRK